MIDNPYSKRFACLKMTMLSLFVTFTLSGCGIRGPLKTPPPLFGGAAKVDQSKVPNEDLDDLDADEDDYIDLDVERRDSLGNL